MRIALGQDVFAHDGVKVGKVDRFVLNDKTQTVEEIVVHKGVVFNSDKLIERVMIDRVDENGVYLTVDTADEEKLPDFYKSHYYEWVSDSVFPYLETLPWGYGGLLLSSTPASPSRNYPGSLDFFDLAPIEPPTGRPESTLWENDVVIDESAEVFSSDHHKLGHVDSALYDEAGTLTGLVVRSGLVHRHLVQIPAAWIADTGDLHIRLNVSAAEAEKAAAPTAGQS